MNAKIKKNAAGWRKIYTETADYSIIRRGKKWELYVRKWNPQGHYNTWTYFYTLSQLKSKLRRLLT